ncbi:MAG: 2-hydroxychromene-2-carboxylate isomerase [Variovorax paradoxus]|nr:MAG: 2-hydroxychromene-2-carboxylate isomerase [Variovorax paradoxus]PZQ07838.1 MAG: 2-hydroxychromene-2-carboxylate isomerase [Variovorax paradoxus]
MPDIEFFFDISSPWTYLAFTNVQPMAAELGATIHWKPFMVGGVFNAVNPTVYESRRTPVPAKQAYLGKSLADWARWTGVQIHFPPKVFPVNSVKLMRGCLVLDAQGRLPAFAKAGFEAYWRDDLDISQDSVVREVCARAGVDADALLAAIGAQEIKDQLRANTEELIARGGFGTPTIFLGDDMYFGNDHLPLVRAALERAR